MSRPKGSKNTKSNSNKNFIAKINARLTQYNKYFGNNFVKTVFGEKLTSDPNVSLVKKSGLLSSKTKLDEETKDYLEQIVQKPETYAKNIINSDDKYIQAAIEGITNKAERLFTIGKEMMAKVSTSGNFKNMLQDFYEFCKKVRKVIQDFDATFPVYEYDDPEYKNILALREELQDLIFDIESTCSDIEEELDSDGKKTYSDISNYEAEISAVEDKYNNEFLAKVETYKNRLNDYLASKEQS